MRDPHKYDWEHYRDKEPSLRDLWRGANVYERACWVMAALGAALIAYLVARRVP